MVFIGKLIDFPVKTVKFSGKFGLARWSRGFFSPEVMPLEAFFCPNLQSSV